MSVEFNVQNQYFPEGTTSYVTVGEIPGTDKADEVVMLGGHLDSWTSATGATDNAIGCAIMMEAARILQDRRRQAAPHDSRRALERRRRGAARIVRVRQAITSDRPKQPKPDFAKLDAYWNIDDGTGTRARRDRSSGRRKPAIVLAQFLKPFEDWGVYGASSSTARVEGGSDNGAFAVAGLPGIGAQQDPIEYNSTTWHTESRHLRAHRAGRRDEERGDDARRSCYSIANRDKMMPRFAPSDDAGRARRARRRRGGPAATRPRRRAAPVRRAEGQAADGGRARPGRRRRRRDRAGDPRRGTVAVVAAPAHGKLALKPDGSFVYTPERSFAGTDTFTYTLTRNAVISSPGTVTFIVQ